MQAQTPVQAPVALAPVPAQTATVVVPVPSAAPISVVGVDWTVLIPLIFVGLGGVITTGFNAWKSVSNGRKSDAIHILVNSGMTKALADLSTAQEEIRTLRELVNALNARVTGAPIASAAVTAAQASTPPTPSAPKP